MAHRAGYSGLQIVLHWAIAVLVVLNYLTSGGMAEALRHQGTGQPPPTMANAHVAFGLAILVLMAVRLGLLQVQGAPPPPGVAGSAAARAARGGHAALYVMLFAVPLGGALVWFGGVTALGDGHALAGNVLMLLAAGHALMALWHHYVRRDALLLRMMRPR